MRKSIHSNRIFWLLFLFPLLFLTCSKKNKQPLFRSAFPPNVTRTWIGPEYWTNPLQDWRLNDGRIECTASGGDRNVFLLTHELSQEKGDFKISVLLGKLEKNRQKTDEGWVGFKVGIQGRFNDYRDSAVHGIGLSAGLSTQGDLFIGGRNGSSERVDTGLDDIRLELTAKPEANQYRLMLSAFDKKGKRLARTSRDGIDPSWLTGGVALVCSHGKIPSFLKMRPGVNDSNWGSRPGTKRGGNVRFWFRGLELNGSKVRFHTDRAFGPILFSQYTLSRGILKLTAQMAPVGEEDDKIVEIQIPLGQNKWETLARTHIDADARTATFRIANWDSSKDIPFRLVYKCMTAAGKKQFVFQGTIRREPVEKKEIVVAAFTGNNDLGFPNNDIVERLKKQDPDFLFFSGDQIYEGVAGYGTQRKPFNNACLDYLRKWYLYGWAYRDLLRDRPAVSIPDDHDVYHGNLWGAGGIATPPGLTGTRAQDEGGYKMPPRWVNMVQRTQTSHLPDPFDPTPAQQGIGVYYCSLNYAGISFAVLEDRKFKSAPKPLLPKAKVWNGWPQNPKFNAKKEADAPGAQLLGDRQLQFLHKWAEDWSHDAWMKVVLSQTIFANVATLPKNEVSGANIPKLRILPANEYPPDDIPVSDMDSNGWPQTGRNRALHEMRRAFAFHIAGDQHLGSTIQYGIDDWHDAGFAFCVPAISNIWPRRWFPSIPGMNRKPGQPDYTGDFKDGFGNKISVYAVSNPVFTGLKPSRLYDRATGYGIVRFNRNTRDITIECWPRISDPTKNPDGQYPGWPIQINQLDNFLSKANFFLPTLEIKGMSNPVIQVIDETKNEIIYSLRISSSLFDPKVDHIGKYTIKIGDPDLNEFKILQDLEPSLEKNKKTIEVVF